MYDDLLTFLLVFSPPSTVCDRLLSLCSDGVYVSSGLTTDLVCYLIFKLRWISTFVLLSISLRYDLVLSRSGFF